MSSLGFVSGQWPCNNVPRTYDTLQIRTPRVFSGLHEFHMEYYYSTKK